MKTTPLPLSVTGRQAIDVVRDLTRNATNVFVETINSPMEIESKGRGNVVTEIDYLIERQSIELLQREYPTFNILSEEKGETAGSAEYTWILDPIDGTRNFVSGMPIFSLTLALMYKDQVVLGATLDPFRDELFLAELGRGTTLNGRDVQIGSNHTVQDGVISSDMGYSDERAHNALKLMVHLWPRTQSIRILGSAALALAYVASGRLDLYFHHMVSPWDTAAGILLVREAGGTVKDRNGNEGRPESQSIVAGNAAIVDDFLKIADGSEWRVGV